MNTQKNMKTKIDWTPFYDDLPPINMGVRGKSFKEDKQRKVNEDQLMRLAFIMDVLRPERKRMLYLLNKHEHHLCKTFGRHVVDVLFTKLSHTHDRFDLKEDLENEKVLLSPLSRCNLRMICPECGYHVQKKRYFQNLIRVSEHVKQGRRIIPMTLLWEDTMNVMDCRKFLETIRYDMWKRRVGKKMKAKYPLFVEHTVDGFHNYEFTIRKGMFHHHVHIAWIVDGEFDDQEYVNEVNAYWKDVSLRKRVRGTTHWNGKDFPNWEQWISYTYKSPFHKSVLDSYDKDGYKDRYYLGLLKLELAKRDLGKNGRPINLRLSGFLNRKASPSVKIVKKKGQSHVISHGTVKDMDVLKANSDFIESWFGEDFFEKHQQEGNRHGMEFQDFMLENSFQNLK